MAGYGGVGCWLAAAPEDWAGERLDQCLLSGSLCQLLTTARCCQLCSEPPHAPTQRETTQRSGSCYSGLLVLMYKDESWECLGGHLVACFPGSIPGNPPATSMPGTHRAGGWADPHLCPCAQRGSAHPDHGSLSHLACLHGWLWERGGNCSLVLAAGGVTWGWGQAQGMDRSDHRL